MSSEDSSNDFDHLGKRVTGCLGQACVPEGEIKRSLTKKLFETLLDSGSRG